jgi:hypothetical protein
MAYAHVNMVLAEVARKSMAGIGIFLWVHVTLEFMGKSPPFPRPEPSSWFMAKRTGCLYNSSTLAHDATMKTVSKCLMACLGYVELGMYAEAPDELEGLPDEEPVVMMKMHLLQALPLRIGFPTVSLYG